MRSRSPRTPTFLLLAGCAAAWFLSGCDDDGKGFDLVDDGGLAAVFLADEPAPGPLTLSMAGGTSSGTAFDIQIRVTGIERFFGAAFRITFDSEAVRYEGFRSDGSFISDAGVASDFRAQLDPNAPGTLVVNATRQGPVAGVDAAESRLLMTISFGVEHMLQASEIEFGGSATRQVTTCPEPPGACEVIPDASLTWAGGRIDAN